MKKFAIIAAIAALGITACSSSGETVAKQGKYEGLTFSEIMQYESIRVPDTYNKQVCSYIQPLTDDGFLSDSDFLEVITKVGYDNDVNLLVASDRDTSRMASIIAASILTACPDQMQFFENNDLNMT